MVDNSQNSKRIAKNTLFLYIRMAFLMCISLFTSRVVLDKLGIEDFGIYNVVGGVAVMFTFFTSSLTNASQRFLTIELGRQDLLKANVVFNQHLILYAIIVGGVLVIAETVGLWFIYNELIIPPERLFAATCVYQFTIISLCFTLLGIVFNSAIIAHENMDVFSFFGIFEGIARLAIVYMLSIVGVDRLILYGFLMLLLTIMLQIIYVIYCSRHYEECKFRFVWDKTLLKETNEIVGWNMVGTAVYAVNDSGINILLNMFFGPVVNTARALSFQVSGAIGNFTTNFFTSVRPQIMKSYSAGDYEYMMTLFYNSSKYSFFLLWMFCLPMAFTCKELFGLWLVDVPEYADVFTLWVLVYSLINSLNNPIWTIALATGKLRRYILIGSGVFLLTFPFSYIVLKFGYSPVSVFVVMVVVRFVYLYVVLCIMKAYIPLTRKEYIKKVVWPILKVMTVSAMIASVLYRAIPMSIVLVLVYCMIMVLISVGCIWVWGISDNERYIISNFLRQKICKNEK